jgi:hypothetical protein
VFECMVVGVFYLCMMFVVVSALVLSCFLIWLCIHNTLNATLWMKL